MIATVDHRHANHLQAPCRVTFRHRLAEDHSPLRPMIAKCSSLPWSALTCATSSASTEGWPWWSSTTSAAATAKVVSCASMALRSERSSNSNEIRANTRYPAPSNAVIVNARRRRKFTRRARGGSQRRVRCAASVIRPLRRACCGGVEHRRRARSIRDRFHDPIRRR